MHSETFQRTAMLLGNEAIDRLAHSSVAVFGAGGVGSYTIEALARSGVGHLMICDADTVSQSNINRQLYALHSTLGMNKVDVASRRIADINPDARVDARCVFFGADTADSFDFSEYDYVVDAIDTVTSKLLICEKARAAGTPVISCMGTGNKLDPSLLEIADIFSTDTCPLARVMRRELRARGFTELKVLYSRETAIVPLRLEPEDGQNARKAVPGSVAFVPSAAGLMIAGEVVRTLCAEFHPKTEQG